MTVRIGVIGTGAIGRDHARRINQVLAGGEIVALSDVLQCRRLLRPEKVKAEIAPQNRSLRDGRRRSSPSPKVHDVVLVASWGATHEQYVLAAITLLGSLASARSRWRRRRTARSRSSMPRVAHGKRLVQVGFMRRYDVGYVALETVSLVAHRRAYPGSRGSSQPDGSGTICHATWQFMTLRSTRSTCFAGCSMTIMFRRAFCSHGYGGEESCEAARSSGGPARDEERGAHRRRGLRELSLRLRHPMRGGW